LPTDVHIQLLPLDQGAPAALVETPTGVHIALDSSDPETAVIALRALLQERFDTKAWTRNDPSTA
jgi:hypothetical protein